MLVQESSQSIFLYYYIHTEIYTLKSRRVNFRSQTYVDQSNVAYCFSHMSEKRYVQSGAAYHVFSRVSHTASRSFNSRLVGAVSYTAQAIALRVWREQIVESEFKAKVVSLKQKGGEKEFELRSQTPTKQPWTILENLRKLSESGRKSSENHQKRCYRYVTIIKRTLHVSSKIWILCSRGKNNISRVSALVTRT